MTYSNSLQGRFIAAGSPVAVMLFATLLLWVVEFFIPTGKEQSLMGSFGLLFFDSALSRGLSFLVYLVIAFVLHHISFFDRYVSFLSYLFLWLTAVMLFIHSDLFIALSVLFFVLSVAQLISIDGDWGQERAVFGAFALLSFSSILLFHFAFLFPMFFLYILLTRIFCIRNLLAAFFGALTPYWLLLGLCYVYPSASVLLFPLKTSLSSLVVEPVLCHPLMIAIIAMELLVYAVAVYGYFAFSFPAKPLLRRRFFFLICLNVYLLFLSLFLPQDYALLLAWRLPSLAVVAAGTFVMSVTKLSNVYFIVLNIMWLLIALFCLWNG